VLYSSPLTLHRYLATQMLGDSATPQLLLSELADPSDTWQARFVEIYNPGQDTVDFGEETWYLSKQSNGGSTWGDILLTGNIPPGECYVVAYSTSAFNSILINHQATLMEMVMMDISFFMEGTTYLAVWLMLMA